LSTDSFIHIRVIQLSKLVHTLESSSAWIYQDYYTVYSQRRREWGGENTGNDPNIPTCSLFTVQSLFC